MTAVPNDNEAESTGLGFANEYPWRVSTPKSGIHLETSLDRRGVNRFTQGVKRVGRPFFVVTLFGLLSVSDRNFVYPKHFHFRSDLLGQRKSALQRSLGSTRSIKANEHFATARGFLFRANDENAARSVLVNPVSRVPQEFPP
jgi:hypothetical protein